MASRKTNRKISTFDGVYKSLGSHPLPKGNRTVREMDFLTSTELAGSIIYENHHAQTDNGKTYAALGYTIDVIFASFSKYYESVDLESLTVAWNSVPGCIQREVQQPVSNSTLKLYSSLEKRWNWPFFARSSRGDTTLLSPTTTDVPPTTLAPSHSEFLTTEQRVAHFYNAIAASAKEQCSNLGVFSNEISGTGEREGEGTEQETDGEGSVNRHWMAEWSQNVMQGSIYSRKPDLVLVDKGTATVDEVTWLSPKVIGEFTKEAFQPAGRLGKTMDTKAYLLFLEQPWRRFVLGLSIANDELRLHFYDRSGGAVSPPFNIHQHPDHLIYILSAVAFGYRSCLGFDPSIKISPPPVEYRGKLRFLSRLTTSSHSPTSTSTSSSPRTADGPALREHTPAIGTIRVGDTVYELVDILFSSPGFLGRGTVCYLARRNGVYYVIKDSWVRVPMSGQRSTHPNLIPVPNEVQIMQRLSHIDGVPKLHGWCFVQVDERDDTTESYREEKWRKNIKTHRAHLRIVMTPYAKPLTAFKSRKELVSCMRDIIRVLESAAKEGVLHRDCSLHNVAIEDLPVADGSSRGLLLDWEFGVQVNEHSQYGLGGTGTIPFMSANLLSQLARITKNNQSLSPPGSAIRKSISIARQYLEDDSTVEHTHADDIESLFYVFIWIIIQYDGPLGRKRQFNTNDSTLLDRWFGLGDDGIAGASDAKIAFLVSHTREEDLKDQISPYFKDLLGLAMDWRKAVAKNLNKDQAVTFGDVLPIFDTFLASMPDEKPPEMTVILRDLEHDHEKLSPFMALLPPITSVMTSPLLTSQKRLSEDVRSMDNPRLPCKRFRHV